MVVLCGYTGGYTELGGSEKFLRQIRDDLTYSRITPAISGRGPKFKRVANAEISGADSGITGSKLLKKVFQRFQQHEHKLTAKALLVMDDTDCRLKDPQKNYRVAEADFISKIKRINPDIEIIFFYADPEIEMWFYYDATNLFNNSVPLIRDLNQLFTTYSTRDWQYDSDKDACKAKYSEKFAEALQNQGIQYSKKREGSEYLGKSKPFSIGKRDSRISTAVQLLQNL